MLHICQLFDKLNKKRKSIIRSTLPIFGISPQCGNRACLREFANFGYSGAK